MPDTVTEANVLKDLKSYVRVLTSGKALKGQPQIDYLRAFIVDYLSIRTFDLSIKEQNNNKMFTYIQKYVL